MNTSAITFGTDGWRAPIEVFTLPRVRAVGHAVATYLRDEGDDRPVAVGYDAREHSAEYAHELAAVLCAHGFDVLLPDRDRPTPVFAYGIVDRNLAGALVITASHNPPGYNGVKFIPSDGAPALPAVTDAIAERIDDPRDTADHHGSSQTVDFVASHANHVLDLVASDRTTAELTVAYDAIHGSGRGTTDRLLEQTDITVERLRCDRDPTFGGGAPEPSAEDLEALIEHVQSGQADFGIVNDGDADRLAIVTPARGYLDENLFFAALYDYLLSEQSGPVVRTVSTMHLLDRIAEAHGEAVYEVPVGVKLRLADGAWLLIRPSGTEPVMRIYAEAEDRDRVRTVLDAGEALVRAEI